MKIKIGRKRKDQKVLNEERKRCSLDIAQAFPSFAEKEEKIRKKAYELYEKRGCQPGHEWDDWFEAEKCIGVQNE